MRSYVTYSLISRLSAGESLGTRLCCIQWVSYFVWCGLRIGQTGWVDLLELVSGNFQTLVCSFGRPLWLHQCCQTAINQKGIVMVLHRRIYIEVAMLHTKASVSHCITAMKLHCWADTAIRNDRRKVATMKVFMFKLHVSCIHGSQGIHIKMYDHAVQYTHKLSFVVRN